MTHRDDHLPYSREGTSHDAAHSMEENAAAIRERIFRQIANAEHGATCDEIEVIGELRHQTASARINELMTAKRIIDSGIKRPTRSGRGAIVWIVAAPVETPVEPPPPAPKNIAAALQAALL